MLHELLTGQLPRSSDNPERLLDAAQPDNPPPATVKPGLDPRLDRVIRKCLSRDPAARYTDGSAVAADLNAWLGRARRWRPIAAAAVVFLIATIATMAIVRNRKPTPEPDQAAVLAEIQKEIAAGKPVTLIGPTGKPRWFDVVVGRDQVKPYVSDVDQTFTIDNSEFVLVELPPTNRDRYRVSAEVRQLTSGSKGDFGLYAGRHWLPHETGGEVDCFATLWFDDADGRGPGGFWTTAVRPHQRIAGMGTVSGGLELAHGEYRPDPPAPGSGWHLLTVDVDPQGAGWTFDGRAAGRTSFQLPGRQRTMFKKTARLAEGADPAFSPAGGYGLIVAGGSASFRNVTVQSTGE
jgi:serine/threonine-protein kinase